MRGIAFHYPPGNLFVAWPGSVGNDEAAHARILRGTGDRIVIGAVHDFDPCAFTGDAINPRLDGAGRDIYLRFQVEESRHVGNGPAVVAVGRGDERERSDRRQAFGEFVDRQPRFEGLAETLLEGSINRPRRAENLEGRQAEATRFVFYQHSPDPEQAR